MIINNEFFPDFDRNSTFIFENSRAKSIKISVSLVYRGNFNDARLVGTKTFDIDKLLNNTPNFVDVFLGELNEPYLVGFIGLINDVLYMASVYGDTFKTELYTKTFTADYDDKYFISSEVSLSTTK